MDFSPLPPAPDKLSFGPSLSGLIRTLLKQTKSEHTRRSYAKAINDLDDFAEGRALSRLLLIDWRLAMHRKPLSPATINLRFTAVRKLFKEARRARLISADETAELLDVPGLPNAGVRTGHWLTTPQCRELLAVPNQKTMRGKRDYCILAVLLGTALRRIEAAALRVEHLNVHDDRWIIENLRGKGGRVRSVALPEWSKEAIAAWMFASGIREGKIIRRLDLDPAGLSVMSISEIVAKAAKKSGVANFTPHDLRRTCAKLCRKNGGELEQIQFMLGHASLVTTERYLGGKQDLKHAVNDNMGF
jgi:integrase